MVQVSTRYFPFLEESPMLSPCTYSNMKHLRKRSGISNLSKRQGFYKVQEVFVENETKTPQLHRTKYHLSFDVSIKFYQALESTKN